MVGMVVVPRPMLDRRRPRLHDLLGNGSQINLDVTDRYAAILGRSPSKGARSPALWNAAFSDLGLSVVMHPMDVDASALPDVVGALRQDPRFVGGAVTVPHKSSMVPLLDEIEPEAGMIGAVNCFYRSGQRLVGANTDGEGALRTLEAAVGPHGLKGATVIVMGIGGAGRAVATYLAGAVGAGGRLVLASRTAARSDEVRRHLGSRCAVELVALPPPVEALAGCDVLVNCTVVGYEQNLAAHEGGDVTTLRPYTPLGPITEVAVPDGPDAQRRHLLAAAAAVDMNLSNSLRALARLRPGATVFDIIYQPSKTLLLALSELYGYRTLNGKGMNLEQAVLAFVRTVRETQDLIRVRRAMDAAAQRA